MRTTAQEYEKKARDSMNDAVISDKETDRAYHTARAQVYATLAVAAATISTAYIIRDNL